MRELTWLSADAAAEEINTVSRELADNEIKGALINALRRIDQLENQIARLIADLHYGTPGAP